MTEIKVAVVGFFSAVGAFLGWQGIMALIWVAAMAIDYISGTAAAMKSGQWSSTVARAGLWHKAGMIVVVIVSVIADITMRIICHQLPIQFQWNSLIMPLVLAWYTITELGSILENAVKMGAAVPAWLTKLLKASLHAVGEAGEPVSEKK